MCAIERDLTDTGEIPVTLADVYDAINNMASRLEQRVNDLTELVQELDQKLDELQETLDELGGLVERGDGYEGD